MPKANLRLSIQLIH